MKIDLFYLSPNPYGGWVTFTHHLIQALKSADMEPELFKIRPRSEKKTRDFGYGERYRNISLPEALQRQNLRLIVAAAKQFKEQTQTLYDHGAYLVVHDPTELKNLPSDLDSSRCVVVRRIGKQYLPKATFIRHPYKNQDWFQNQRKGYRDKKKQAISTSRIDFDKHTEILLDANRLLPEEKKIDIRGFENRIFTRFKIVPKYPEWVQSVAQYPRTKDAAYDLMLEAKFNVDMTEIKGDGGGTQYTWLEAWDAACIPIINQKWILKDWKDDMIPDWNCLTVEDGEQLARLLAQGTSEFLDDECISMLVKHGFKSLEKHEPSKIGSEYKKFFERAS